MWGLFSTDFRAITNRKQQNINHPLVHSNQPMSEKAGLLMVIATLMLGRFLAAVQFGSEDVGEAEALDCVVLKALSLEKEDCWQSAVEMKRVLEVVK